MRRTRRSFATQRMTPQLNAPLMSFDHVGLRYGTGPEILHDVSFALEAGSFHFITGPSGAGKTSLLRLMYLGHRPSRGLFHVFGREFSGLSRDDLARMRRKIGVVFQDFRLLPHLSAYENVLLPLKVTGQDEVDVREHVVELLDWVGLGDYIHAKPPTLSGGEQQRVAIARAVINRPKLILADEPTGNVDAKMGRRILHLFEQLHHLGTTVVIATHDQGLIERFGYARLEIERGYVHPVPGDSGEQTKLPLGTGEDY